MPPLVMLFFSVALLLSMVYMRHEVTRVRYQCPVCSTKHPDRHDKACPWKNN